MKKITLSLGALVAISSLGFADGDMAPVVMQADESSFYLGLGMSAVSTRDSSVDLSFTSEEVGQDRLANATFIAGYNINQYFAVEGRYTSTFTDEDLVEMDGLSIFVKPQYPVSADFSLYALLGYGSVSMDEVNHSGVDVDESGFQWGLGASYAIGENYTLFIDYTSLAVDMDGTYYNGALQVDADAVTLGVTYKF